MMQYLLYCHIWQCCQGLGQTTQQQLQKDFKLNMHLLQEQGASSFVSGAETLVSQHIPGFWAVCGWELWVRVSNCFYFNSFFF